MIRHHPLIGLGLVLFLALDAIGLIIFSSPSSAYSAPLVAPTVTPRVRGVAPTVTPQTRRASPKVTERHVCTPSGGDFATIQAAVDASAPGDVIKVAAGVYTESKFIGFQQNLYISKTVHIFGGYTCSNWATRNYTSNITSIRPFTSTWSVVTINGQYGNSAALTPTIDGFTISGARSDNHGGGIRMNDSDALIANNIITDNTAYLFGGGAWVQRGAPRFENNGVQNNRTDWNGGGIQLEGTQATVLNNIISGNVVSNTVAYGGGIDMSGGPVTITNNTIVNNSVSGPPGSIGYGGGVSMQNVTATLSNNLIQDNKAHATRTGFGGGVFITNTRAFTLTSNTIVSNTAGYLETSTRTPTGGGLYIDRSAGLLNSNIITGNIANGGLSGYGGGIGMNVVTVTVQGGQISTNQSSGPASTGFGNALYVTSSLVTLDAVHVQNNYGAAGGGGSTGNSSGIYFGNSPFTLTNSLITGNNNIIAGAVYVDTGSRGFLINNTFVANGGSNSRALLARGPFTLTNSIVMSQEVGIEIVEPTVPYSVTYNNFWANAINTQGGITLDSSNIFVNPQLDSSYHLNAGSPMIDAGTHTNAPDHDMDSQPRAMVGTSGLFRIDIGADERTGTAQRVVNLNTTPADLTIIGPGNPLENPGSNGSSDWIGYAVLVNDITGDNHADLVIAAEDWAEDFDTLNATGRLFGLSNFGTRITGTIELISSSPNITVVSKYIRQHLGSALASGDLNNDGKRDLIAGSYDNDNDNTVPITPTVFVLWGGASLTGTRTLTNSTPADFMLRAPAQDFFAFSAKNALTTGRLNADAIDDLVVADYKANDGGSTEAGAAFVVFGSGGLGGLRDLAVTPADFTLYGPSTNAHLGSVAVGRVNAGSQVDLVARTDVTAYVKLGPLGAGTQQLNSTPANITITGLQAGGVIVTDLTGDGQDDVILGSGNNIYVIPGPLVDGMTYNASSAAALTLALGVSPSSLAAANVTGDTKLDLIIGVSAFNARQAFVVPGGLGASGNLPIADVAQIIVQGNGINALGFDVAAGDLDNDNQPDLVVSSWQKDVPSHPNKFQDAGQVFVFYGNGGSGPPLTQKIYLPLILK